MLSRRSLLFGLAGAGAAAATTALARSRGGRAARLPDPFGPLVALTPRFPAGFGVRRVFVDPGHGAAGNTGNASCFCREEQDFTMAAGRALAAELRATGAFEVRLAREGPGPVAYQARVEDAEAWGAEVFLSLHSDVRGQTGERWNPEPGRECVVSLAAPGYSVLWSDEGEPKLAGARHALARSVARRMREAGFSAYAGVEYGDLYAVDPEQPGVFVDRHTPERRIFVLRRPKMPSVLVETHHALDPRDARRWDEPATLVVFASAVGAALVDVLSS
ncbi:N-acetylmuramoyl-L-alanine amidase [Polyangium sorediatum]|uniref:N-acetylmuramoyl-L-alanine amidase n=1 Tax=Polyangium sorediatum TaxID=889274 RepID=A0ABT6P8W4_9BACT|nr:N-acetylmuramoyl-L-alanine amidase [Polyangium sorediatum]MDI1436757.1 N-acetylmuramoyl-L-alanine amidase [Polyangium sorediatum]